MAIQDMTKVKFFIKRNESVYEERKKNRTFIELNINSIDELEVLSKTSKSLYESNIKNMETYNRNSEWLLAISSGGFFLLLNLIYSKSDTFTININHLYVEISLFLLLLVSCFLNRILNNSILFYTQSIVSNYTLWDFYLKKYFELNSKIDFPKEYWEYFSKKFNLRLHDYDLKCLAFTHGYYLTDTFRQNYEGTVENINRIQRMKKNVSKLMYLSFIAFIMFLFYIIFNSLSFI